MIYLDATRKLQCALLRIGTIVHILRPTVSSAAFCRRRRRIRRRLHRRAAFRARRPDPASRQRTDRRPLRLHWQFHSAVRPVRSCRAFPPSCAACSRLFLLPSAVCQCCLRRRRSWLSWLLRAPLPPLLRQLRAASRGFREWFFPPDTRFRPVDCAPRLPPCGGDPLRRVIRLRRAFFPLRPWSSQSRIEWCSSVPC